MREIRTSGLMSRLRHPQPRSCGGGSGVDEGGDDQARACAQRGEDLDPERPAGTLRLPWIHVRAASLSEGRPLVSGREPVSEERATAQSQGRRDPDPWQPDSVDGGTRPAEQPAARLVLVFQPRYAPERLPGDRPSRLSQCPSFPGTAPQGANAWHPPLPAGRGVRRTRRTAIASGSPWPAAVCVEMKV